MLTIQPPALAVWVCGIKSSWTRLHRVICLISILQNVKIEQAAVRGWDLTVSVPSFPITKAMLFCWLLCSLPPREEKGSKKTCQQGAASAISALFTSLTFPFHIISLVHLFHLLPCFSPSLLSSLLPTPSLLSSSLYAIFSSPFPSMSPAPSSGLLWSFGAAYLQMCWVSQTSLRIALPSLGPWLLPSHFPQHRFSRCLERWHFWDQSDRMADEL